MSNRLLKVSGGRCTVLGYSLLGGGTEAGDASKRVWKSSSVVGLELHSLEAVAERRMMDMMNTVLNNPSYPLHDELWQMDSTISHQLSSTLQAFTCAHCHHSNCDHSLGQL